MIIAAKLPDGRPTGGYRELPSGKQSSQVVKNPHFTSNPANLCCAETFSFRHEERRF